MSIYLRDRNFKKTEFKSEQKIYNYLSDKKNYLKYYEVSINNGLNWIDGDKYFNSINAKYSNTSSSQKNTVTRSDDNHLKGLVDAQMGDLLKKLDDSDKSKNYKNTNSSKSSSSSNGIYIVILIAVAIFIYNKKSSNNHTNKSSYTNQTIRSDDTSRVNSSNNSDNSNSSENLNSNQPSNGNYDSKKSNNTSESQTYTCLACNGEGRLVCADCKGKGSKLCTSCNGLGYITERDGYSHGCSTCLNKGVVDCEPYTVCGESAGAFMSGGGCGGTRYVDKETHEKQLQMKKYYEDVFK